MGWFKRKPVNQKQVEAIIQIASNLYENTKPGAANFPDTLQFSLPDSRYRYLIFCLSTALTATAPEMNKNDFVTVSSQSMHFLVLTATQSAQEFFGCPITFENAASFAFTYIQEFLKNWASCVEFEKESKDSKINDLICSMIHATESNEPVGQSDKQRLGKLALQIDCWLPTMRGAFIELISQ